MSSTSRPFGYPLAAPRVDARSAAVWLLLIAVIGGVLTFSHGISKKFNDEWEYTQVESLTYEPAAMAIVFAIVMLPLVFGFARAEAAGTAEAWVLWYMLCVAAYGKDFSYLHIPGIPLYCTDYLLLFLLIGTFIFPRLRVPHPLRMPTLGVLLLLGTGGIAALRGLAGGEDKILIARDYAMVAYSLFALIAATMFRSWAQIKRLMLMLVLGSVLLGINGFGWLLNAPGQRRYVLYANLLPGAFVWILTLTMNKTVPRLHGWLATAALGVALFVANTRAEYVGVMVALAGLVFLGPSPKHGSLVMRLKAVAAVVAICLALLVAVMQTDAGGKLVTRIVADSVSAVVDPGGDPTAQFRFLAWAEAVTRFLRQPLLGEGYGIAFKFGYWDQVDSRAHNTFLTVLYKSGMVGFLPLAFFLAHLYWRGLRASRTGEQPREAGMMTALVLSTVAVLMTGMFTLVFESPFVAGPLWVMLGAVYAGVKLLRRSPQQAEAAVR
jgi:O-antigen ligase